MKKVYSAKCRNCGKIVRVKPGRDGDWLGALYTYRHKQPNGTDCKWWENEVQTSDLIKPTTPPKEV